MVTSHALGPSLFFRNVFDKLWDTAVFVVVVVVVFVVFLFFSFFCPPPFFFFFDLKKIVFIVRFCVSVYMRILAPSAW